MTSESKTKAARDAAIREEREHASHKLFMSSWEELSEGQQSEVIAYIGEDVETDDGTRYRVVRHFFNSNRKVTIKRNLPLSLAQAHCRDPETSSRTCTKAEGKRRTRRYGPWFDGYTENK